MAYKIGDKVFPSMKKVDYATPPCLTWSMIDLYGVSAVVTRVYMSGWGNTIYELNIGYSWLEEWLSPLQDPNEVI